MVVERLLWEVGGSLVRGLEGVIVEGVVGEVLEVKGEGREAAEEVAGDGVVVEEVVVEGEEEDDGGYDVEEGCTDVSGHLRERESDEREEWVKGWVLKGVGDL